MSSSNIQPPPLRSNIRGSDGLMSAAWNVWFNTLYEFIRTSISSNGLLAPSLTTSERDDISNPPNGLIIYNTTESSLQAYINDGWREISYT